MWSSYFKCLGLAGISLAVSLVVWSRVPDAMPVHWNIDGEPDSFWPKAFGLLFFPALIVVISTLFPVIYWLDPRREHIQRSRGALGWIFLAAAGLQLAVQVLVILASLSADMKLNEGVLIALLGVMFIVIGNVLPKLRSNWFAGIRTPWTLSSETVWRRTHRLAGWTFVGGGVGAVIAALVLHGWLLLVVFMVLVAVAGLTPCVYSFLIYGKRQEPPAAQQAS